MKKRRIKRNNLEVVLLSFCSMRPSNDLGRLFHHPHVIFFFQFYTNRHDILTFFVGVLYRESGEHYLL